MIVEPGALEGDVEDDAEYVIVGTGAAGATAARVLAEAGAGVVLVEEGPNVPAAELARGTVASFGRLLRDAGGQVTSGPLKIPLLQGACVGGSTVVNSGITWRIPPWVYDRWAAEFGLSGALPARELEACFDLLDEELSVRQTREERLGGNGRVLRTGAERLGWESKTTHRTERDCEGSARCLEGCANGRRQSMNHSYIPRALAAGARLYAGCRVTRVCPRSAGGLAVEGTFALGAGGGGRHTLRAHARKAVLIAASAIHTPALVLRSGLDSTGQVGLHFQGHPGVSMLALFDEPIRLWEGATQAYEITEFRQRGMKIESLSLPAEVLAARLPGVGAKLAAYLRQMDRIAVAAIPIKARARGTVRTLGPFNRVNYCPEPQDVALAVEGLARVGQAFFAAGARAVLPGIHGLPERISDPAGLELIRRARPEPGALNWVMTHMMGSCRMGGDPRTSAVDLRGQLHGVPGVHVIDSSVFPTNLGVNPQHTIMAVAMVLARRLLEDRA
ncbi:MAG: GMC family oxidoreductase [Candidatus Wallbacteria bacterium]|nr:GMC family oxidoreductase [Candidatus Wallbacteria bacterium]